MTIGQWAVCGCVAWHIYALGLSMLSGGTEFTLKRSVVGGLIYGIVGALLGWLWNL